MARTIKYLSLFAGHAGLDLGFRLGCEAIGIVARCVGYVEREAYAASCLLGRMEESALERAPVFCGDICELDGRPMRGHVNAIIGGFPCQDISQAGKGAGIVKGNRSGLWFEFARLIEEIRPDFVFLENVSAIIHRGLDSVLGELARLGFDAEWDCFTAAQVGAPHKRERWFCLAHRRCAGDERRDEPGGMGSVQGTREGQGAQRERPRGNSGGEGCILALPAQRGQRERRQSPGRDGQPDGGDETLDNPASTRRDGAGQWAEAVSESGQRLLGEGRSELANAKDPDRGGRISGEEEGTGPEGRGRRGFAGSGCDVEHPESAQRGRQDAWRETLAGIASRRPSAGGDELGDTTGSRREGWSGFGRCADERLPFPPGPADRDAWARIIEASPHLAPAVEPGVRVLADGLALVVDAARADQLRGCGNGVVPLQAALAFATLAGRCVKITCTRE